MVEDEDVLFDALTAPEAARDGPYAHEAELLIERDGALVAGDHGVELQAGEAMGRELAQAVLDERAPHALPALRRGDGVARVRHMGAPSDVVGMEDVQAADAVVEHPRHRASRRARLHGHGGTRLLAEERQRLLVGQQGIDLRKRISRLDHLVPDGGDLRQVLRAKGPYLHDGLLPCRRPPSHHHTEGFPHPQHEPWEWAMGQGARFPRIDQPFAHPHQRWLEPRGPVFLARALPPTPCPDWGIIPLRCGRSSMAEPEPSKLLTRVRFPSPAPREPSRPEAAASGLAHRQGCSAACAIPSATSR